MALPRIQLHHFPRRQTSRRMLIILFFATMATLGVVLASAQCDNVPAAVPAAAAAPSVETASAEPRAVKTAAPVHHDPLATTILGINSSGRRTGELSSDGARQIAVAIRTYCDGLDPYLVTSLAWTESGFRTSAVSPSGRHMGLFQVLRAAVPDDIGVSTAEACSKLRRWRSWCGDRHDDHPWLAHWFSGTNVSHRGLVAARVVTSRTKRLRRML